MEQSYNISKQRVNRTSNMLAYFGDSIRSRMLPDKVEPSALRCASLNPLQMATPAGSGRKQARVDWKGRYMKFKNEAGKCNPTRQTTTSQIVHLYAFVICINLCVATTQSTKIEPKTRCLHFVTLSVVDSCLPGIFSRQWVA